MMRSAITISLVPEAKDGPFVFWNGLEHGCAEAARLGFDGVEIFPPDAEAVDMARTKSLLSTHGLAVAAIGTGGGWVRNRLTLTHPDAVIRRKAREFIRAIVDVAGALGAPAIIGSMQGRWEGTVTREQALAWLAEALEDVGEHAIRHGVPLLYEPLNRYETNLLHRLAETADWLRTLRTRNIRILADLFHMNIEEADSPTALRAVAPLLGHLHFADSNRRAVGLGQTAIAPIVAALREIGYAGYLSAEILPLPSVDVAATQAIAAFRASTATG